MKTDILGNLNPEQQRAVTHEKGPLLIIAGAGTGKTTVITKRIAWLIMEKKLKPDEILALTFTEKASGEMEERVDKLLPYGYVDLWVSTFHSFAEKILRLHGLDIGLPTNFRLLSETEQWYLVRRNLDRFNLEYYRPLGNPTKFIHALLRHFSRAKDEEIGPEEYLAYAEKLRLDQGLEKGVKANPDVISRGSDSAEGVRRKKQKPEQDAGDGLAEESKRLEEVANAYHVYQKLLLENSALDFGDLINYVLKLFKTRPNILEHYRKQFKYILVDEFQDTNWAQYELVKLLAAPQNNLTVVGDDDQSIYKFRGASVSNILTFKKDFSKSTDVVLTRNYRSPQSILDLSYQFIQQNNPNRLEAKLSAENAERNADGAEKTLPVITKKLRAAKGDKGIIEYIAATTQEQEARKVAEKIIHLRNTPRVSAISALSWSDFAILIRANHEADVFMRALDAGGVPYEFLASRGLYAKPLVMDILAYFRLLDNYHESSALYRLLTSSVFSVNHEDVVKLLNEARKKTLSLFEACQTLAMSSDISEESRKKIAQLLKLIERHTALSRQKPASRVLYALINDSGMLATILKDQVQEKFDAINILRQLFKKIEAFESTVADPTVRAFVESVNLSLEAGDEGSLDVLEDEGPDTVKIMTVHGAKGLEFEYVFVANLVDKRFPTVERKDPIELPDALVKEILPEGDIHLEEERRLMYVAMTRAKKGLFLTSAEDYGGARKKKPSRFLVELGFVQEEVQVKKSVKKNDEVIESIKANSKFADPANTHLRKKLPPAATAHFSFTQLKAFETCPYQYRFAHVIKIPVEGKHMFSFGKSMHKTLELFYRRMQDLNKQTQAGLFNRNIDISIYRDEEKGDHKKVAAPTLDDLLKLYEESWIGEWYQSRAHHDEYKEKGKNILKEYYAKNQNTWTVPTHLEQVFHLKVGGETLKGAIDRIDLLPTGKIEIIDYKTGTPKVEGKIRAEDKEQLLIYQLAAKEILGLETEKLTYYYLDNNEPVSFVGSEKDLDALKVKISGTISEIQKGEFPPDPEPMKCKYCDFVKICEFRKLV